MGKRKRTDEEALEELLAGFRQELHHALKTAKGFERQRQSKRLRDAKVPADKRQRIQNEAVVLKSLDLQQTAHAHLCASLLRIKSIAESSKLPADIKSGAAKPDLTEEERIALHNVTSALYCRAEVRTATDKAIAGVCTALGLPVPDKRGKGKKPATKEEGKKDEKDEPVTVAASIERDPSSEKRAKKEEAKKLAKDDDNYDSHEEIEEKAISKFEEMLGSSSDEEDDDTPAQIAAKRNLLRQAVAAKELDPMEITDDEGGEEEEDDDDDGYGDLDPMEISDGEDDDDEGDNSGSEDSSFEGFGDLDISNNRKNPSKTDKKSARNVQLQDEESESSSDDGLAPPPRKKLAKEKKSSKTSKTAAVPVGPVTGSTFLPSLMGGYISGSESASDLDEVLAPARKNRRGQRARQAIWEKKFKDEAKHVKNGTGRARDAGWDLKRGAVGDGKPWKQGIKNPLGEGGSGEPKKERKPSTRDDLGTLHPSWEARKKLKESQLETAPYAGKKIKFDH
ncbi:Bud-site selection protein [Podospora appendiculata]|uniref:Bud-site selection protein n=1 Tax=Podospora appendiculata TaxID=314037 RepID=A0AAE0X109_9PEZI|nr:Bud-site selection protein [Podospora appendiculata]